MIYLVVPGNGEPFQTDFDPQNVVLREYIQGDYKVYRLKDGKFQVWNGDSECWLDKAWNILPSDRGLLQMTDFQLIDNGKKY